LSGDVVRKSFAVVSIAADSVGDMTFDLSMLETVAAADVLGVDDESPPCPLGAPLQAASTRTTTSRARVNGRFRRALIAAIRRWQS